MKFFNSLTDFSHNELETLTELAAHLQKSPEPEALKGKILALFFLSPSLRTLCSFQSGMARLGGNSFVVSPDMSIHGLETRDNVVMNGAAAEHINEALPVIASFADAIGIRAFAKKENLEEDVEDKFYKKLNSLIDIPTINMESAIEHPCQSLADWKTLNEIFQPKRKAKFVLSWAYHPRALPLAVPASTLNMSALKGMDVTIAQPEGFELPTTIINKAKILADHNGGSLTISNNYQDAIEDADIIYAKSWSSTRHYGDEESDLSLRNIYKDWCVSESWFDTANTECKFMHCLPARRGVVVDNKVLDSSRSVVIQQAQNRMWAQMAVLYHMLKGA
jgi:N-acetylornithine carbamoyltransferase